MNKPVEMFAFALTSTRTHRPKQAEAKRKGCKVPALGEAFANAGQKSNLLTLVSLSGALCQPFSLLQPNTRHKAIRGMAYFGSRVGGIVCHGGRGCEAAGHIAPTVRRQRDESPCLARFLFTQSMAGCHLHSKWVFPLN